MSLLRRVLVFTEDLTALPELCSGGRQLASEVIAIVIGNKENAETAGKYGAKTYWLGEKSTSSMVEDYTKTFAQIIRAENPNLILLKGTKRGKLIAGKLSVILNAGVITDAMDFEIVDETSVMIKHLVYGGLVIRTEKPISKTTIALVGSGIFETTEAMVQREIIEFNELKLENKITCLEIRPKEGERIDLSMAKRIIGVGRGIAKKEDLAMVEELATTLGAEIACSRPIAEGENWLAKSRYIGVSGANIKPDIYLAVGISGQVQHMVGINGAKTIIAINKDKNAPIFQKADYGIVGDLYKIVPGLVRLIKN